MSTRTAPHTVPGCEDRPVADLELLDCGDGRRLERFGGVVADRPAPGATEPRRDPGAWRAPDLVWVRAGAGPGRWDRGAEIGPWAVDAGGLRLELRPAAGGQVGVFAEHVASLPWLDEATRAAAGRLGRPPEILSLFAYTGATTLACARAGARVVHVDSSRPAVAWARRNAELSELADRPVRWIVDDARGFVRRERRRGRMYDGVILDPPSWGHGTGAWRLEDDLAPLLENVAALLGPRPSLVVLSAHTPGYDGDRLAAAVREHLGVDASPAALDLVARSGAILRLGAAARYARGLPSDTTSRPDPRAGRRR